MLHITNGDSAVDVMDRAGIPGHRLPWRDVLHEGPVPGGADARGLRAIRAQFIAGNGWAEYAAVLADFERRDALLDAAVDQDEVVLWFEHDLYDQLQLVQVLDRLASLPGRLPPVSLICDREYLGRSTPERLQLRFAERRPLPEGALAVARTAWAAFTAPEPTAMTVLAADGDDTLPFVRAAFRRALEEYPSHARGLSRTESQILAALSVHPRTPEDLFRAAPHDVEDPVFMGDSVFAMHLARLAGAAEPALVAVDGDPVEAARAESAPGRFWKGWLGITDFGRALYLRRADWVEANGLDRWLGGVHFTGRRTRWRWDGEKGALAML